MRVTSVVLISFLATNAQAGTRETPGASETAPFELGPWAEVDKLRSMFEFGVMPAGSVAPSAAAAAAGPSFPELTSAGDLQSNILVGTANFLFDRALEEVSAFTTEEIVRKACYTGFQLASGPLDKENVKGDSVRFPLAAIMPRTCSVLEEVPIDQIIANPQVVETAGREDLLLLPRTAVTMAAIAALTENEARQKAMLEDTLADPTLSGIAKPTEAQQFGVIAKWGADISKADAGIVSIRRAQNTAGIALTLLAVTRVVELSLIDGDVMGALSVWTDLNADAEPSRLGSAFSHANIAGDKSVYIWTWLVARIVSHEGKDFAKSIRTWQAAKSPTNAQDVFQVASDMVNRILSVVPHQHVGGAAVPTFDPGVALEGQIGLIWSQISLIGPNPTVGIGNFDNPEELMGQIDNIYKAIEPLVDDVKDLKAYLERDDRSDGQKAAKVVETSQNILGAIEVLVETGFMMVPGNNPNTHDDVKKAFVSINAVLKIVQAGSEHDAGKAMSATLDLLKLVIPHWDDVVPEPLTKTLMMITAAGNAKSTDDVESALKAWAGPVGSYKSKHEGLGASFGVNAYVGAFAGSECPYTEKGDCERTDRDYRGHFAPVASIGPEVGGRFALGRQRQVSGYIGFQVPILDLGQLIGLRLQKDAEPVKVNFASVLAPGTYLVLAPWKAPFAIGGGASYMPAIKGVRDEFGVRVGGFIAVDIPLVHIHAGGAAAREEAEQANH